MHIPGGAVYPLKIWWFCVTAVINLSSLQSLGEVKGQTAINRVAGGLWWQTFWQPVVTMATIHGSREWLLTPSQPSACVTVATYKSLLPEQYNMAICSALIKDCPTPLKMHVMPAIARSQYVEKHCPPPRFTASEQEEKHKMLLIG